MNTWTLEKASWHLPTIVRRAQRGVVQTVTSHSKPVAVVVSAETYQRLVAPKMSFLELMRSSPSGGVELHITREGRRIT